MVISNDDAYGHESGWKINKQRRSAATFGLILERPIALAHAFFHAKDTETFLRRRETSAIVLNLQNETAIAILGQTHMDNPGASVPDDIAKSFLHDSLDAGLVFF